MVRRTHQRDAVRKVFDKSKRPLSPDEVLAAARRWSDTIGQATVYRALSRGVEEGWLRAVEMPTGPTRYEPASLPHHHHFECVDCHRVFDVEGCPGKLDKMLPDGFTLQSHEILLFGQCERCSA